MRRQHWQDWITLILGIWTLISPWVLHYSTAAATTTGPAAWNFYILGVALIVLGIAEINNRRVWEEWVDVVLGIWLILSPWALGFAGMTALMWNGIIVGAVVIIVAGSVLLIEPVKPGTGHPA